MSKRKNTRNLKSSYTSQDSIVFSVILMIILLFAWVWALIVYKNGLQGASYFFTAFDLILVIMVSVPYTLKSAIASAVRRRTEQKLYRSAKGVLNAGLLLAILYSLAVILLIYIFSESLTQSVLIGSKSHLTLIILTISILFYSVACAFMGYFEGLGESFSLLILIAYLLSHVIMIISTVIFSHIFMNHGTKAANVLGNQETRYAYGAAGAAVGIIIGVIVLCVVILFLYQFYGRQLRKLMHKDASKRRTDTVDLVIRLVRQTLPLAGSYLMILLYQVIDQLIFFRIIPERNEIVLQTYRWGAYAGIYRGVMILPLIIVFVLSLQEKEKLAISFSSGDSHNVRILSQKIIKDNMIIALFFTALILVMADKIIAGFFMTESVLAARLIRFGCIGLVLMSLSVTLLVILSSIKKLQSTFFTGLLALTANIITVYIAIKYMSMGVYGAMLAFIIFGLVYCALGMNFLRRATRTRIDMLKTFYLPAISAVIITIIMLILDLLFGLFLPAAINVILTAILSFVAYFAILVKLEVISEYTISSFPFGNLLMKLGKNMGLFR